MRLMRRLQAKKEVLRIPIGTASRLEAALPCIVAHRGASGLEPENTCRSFRRAQEVGADMLELDVRVSRDGQLVIMHDAAVDRTTNGSGTVARMTWRELRKLDAGKGECVPTLEEVLACTVLPIQVELKVADAIEPLLRLLEQPEARRRIIPISFEPAVVQRITSMMPDLPAGLVAVRASQQVVKMAHAAGASLVSVGSRRPGERFMGRCRDAGLWISVWTVDRPAAMEFLIARRVDAIVTNRPDRLVEIERRVRGKIAG